MSPMPQMSLGDLVLCQLDIWYMLLDPCCSRMLLAILPVRPLGRPSVTAFSQESFIAFF